VLSNNNNKLMLYIYSQKHNNHYRTFIISKVQLHVSAINFGHLQVVHEELNDKLYLHLSGVIYIVWDGVGARSRFVFVEGVGSQTRLMLNHKDELCMIMPNVTTIRFT